MTGIITLNIAGTDTGNFNLYSNADVYSSAFAVNITRVQLLAGYVTDAIPNGTTIIRIRSIGVCQNSIDIVVPPQACYNFLPTDSYYLLDTISKSTYAYAYGPFDGYIENGIATTYKNLIKLNLDLTIDTSFDVGTGFDEILYTGSSILEQPDGKIIVTGTFTTYQGVTQNRIVRLNTDATVDATFITGTGFNNFTQSPAIDSNGSIIVTGIFNTYNGSSSPRIARLLSNGTIDPTFIIGSGFNNTTTDVLVNSDDSMFILGYFDSYNGTAVSPGITKLLPNGNIDPSFNAGTGITPYVPNNANYFARIPGETSFYVGGFLTDYDGTTISQIIKLNIDGTVDTSFNSGTGFDGVNLYSLAAVWGDKLIIEGDFLNYNGTSSNYAIILNADGSVYYTFDSTYMSPIIIGDNLFGAEFDDCLQLLHTFIPQFCNLEGTGIITVPPTTTTTTTIPLDCTIIGTGVITVPPTTTTTTTVFSLNYCVNYGYLYNWWAATDIRNIAPIGWHVPSQAEMTALRNYIDPVNNDPFTNIAGGKMKETGTTYWTSPNTGADNSTGFNGRGGGERSQTTGAFINLNGLLALWNTRDEITFGGVGTLFYDDDNFQTIIGNVTNKENGRSIRLIKDDSIDTGYMTGNDGKTYPTVTIGTQVWLAENLTETKYRDGSFISGPSFTNINWTTLITEAYCVYADTESNAGTIGACTTTTTTTL